MVLLRYTFLLLFLLGCSQRPASFPLFSSVYNGNPSTESAVVALTNSEGFFCSGVVISPRLILTAAHCLDGEYGGVADIMVYVGSGSDGGKYYGQYQLDRIHVHPNYGHASPGRFDYGLAVVHADLDVVPAIVLQSAVEALEVYKLGRELTLVGFGKRLISGDGLFEQRYGSKYETSSEIALITRNSFATHRDKGVACSGDSGGATFATLDSGERRLIGIHSASTKMLGFCRRFGMNGKSSVAMAWVYSLLKEYDKAFEFDPRDPALARSLGEIELAQTLQRARDEALLIHESIVKGDDVSWEIADLDYPRVSDGMTALLLAIEYNREDLVRSLLEGGANPNAITLQGVGALQQAVISSTDTVLQILLSAGADPNLGQNTLKSTAMELAIKSDRPELLRILLERGADPGQGRSYLKESPLGMALEMNRLAHIEILLEYGVDLTLQDKDGREALFMTLGYGKSEAAAILLDAGANPNFVDPKGDTPLLKASYWGELSTVEALLDAGADCNFQNLKLDTALHVATRQSKVDIVALLLDRGADRNVLNGEGKKASDYALEQDNQELIELLKLSLLQKIKSWFCQIFACA